MGIGTAYGKWSPEELDECPGVIFACGPEQSLKDEMVEVLDEQFPDPNREILSLYADESTPEELTRELNSQGMFSESRWIILKRMDFRDGGKTMLKRYYDTLEEYLEDPDPDTMLVVYDSDHPYQGGRRTGGFARAVEGAGEQAVVFWEPFERELYQRTRSRLEENDLEWESGTVEAIVNRCQEKWERIQQETGKLLDYFESGDRIEPEDVDRIISSEESSDVLQDVKQAAVSGDPDRMMEALDDFYRQSGSRAEMQAAHAVLFYFQNLRDIRRELDEGKSLEEALENREIPTSKGIKQEYRSALKQLRSRFPETFYRSGYQLLKDAKYGSPPINRRSLEQFFLGTLPDLLKT